jgi:hypothetical protein
MHPVSLGGHSWQKIAKENQAGSSKITQLFHWLKGGEPGGIRTHDPMIKSHVLYRLSYGPTSCHINALRNFGP